KEPGKWTPTPPAYLAAIEPYWSEMRTAVMGSEEACAIKHPAPFSTDSSSNFYKLAKEVYDVKNNISDEQNTIANFWDCNPFNVNTNGHLMFAVKKLSPGGHWMNIATIAAEKNHADLTTATAAYALTAIAIYDGFINCWKEKYRSNLIRPETYINNVIDAKWHPVLQTPPFPEYPSGHSVISMAAATVLTYFFGNNFSFNDNTEINYGLPVRNYPSFISAANEAAISRLYGGIHYREAIDNGKELGKETGGYVLKNIKIRRS
ncbi:MAG: vanadium-dependent haloperoxidase, partial [Bacteroidota bacterium]|nr:vanadium-dependent haloperoxidase [Bacteroidota bacterium]